jgi:two-component system NarL family sensor kinase
MEPVPSPVDLYFIFIVGSCGMLLLGAAAIFLFVTYYRRNIRAKEELHAAETKYQQELIYSNLQTLEDERKRFAEDLHDEVGASLSAIRLHASRIEHDVKEAETKGRIKDVKDIIDQAIASTRRISHNMLPPGIEFFGLPGVTEDLAIQISGTSLLKVDIHAQENIARPEAREELMLYRVLQELLNNTIKHAEATRVNISFASNQDEYIIRYSDNGKGFDARTVRYNGLGLRNLENRIKLIKGNMELISSPGQGLRVNITIPLSH